MFYFMCFFFFKQKTAYEIRISDWSSYVFSSDLPTRARAGAVRCRTQAPPQPVAARLPAAHGADLRHLLHRRTVLLPDGRLAGDRLHGRRRAVDLPGVQDQLPQRPSRRAAAPTPRPPDGARKSVVEGKSVSER